MKLSDYIRVAPALDTKTCEDLVGTYCENDEQAIRRLNRVQAFHELNYNQVAEGAWLTYFTMRDAMAFAHERWVACGRCGGE